MGAWPAVIDCSVMVDLLVSDDSERLQEVIGVRELHAPAHFDAEVLSALRGLLRGGHLSRPRCRDALIDFDDFAVNRWLLTPVLGDRALDMAGNATSHDTLYIVLAKPLAAPC